MTKTKETNQTTLEHLRSHAGAYLGALVIMGGFAAAHEMTKGYGKVQPNPNVAAHINDGVNPANIVRP